MTQVIRVFFCYSLPRRFAYDTVALLNVNELYNPPTLLTGHNQCDEAGAIADIR
jgi:hypothetical protein